VTKRIRIADLVGSPVEDLRGKRLGRVVDLELGPDYEVVAALIGPRSWLKRWNVAGLWGTGNQRRPDRVPWSRVASFDSLRLRLKD
jgi:sporulation protein YlmC with PRC-barrel domain